MLPPVVLVGAEMENDNPILDVGCVSGKQEIFSKRLIGRENVAACDGSANSRFV
jgi:hypothetical protein